MYPPRFSQREYSVTDVIEEDQSAVGRLITAVRYTHIHGGPE